MNVIFSFLDPYIGIIIRVAVTVAVSYLIYLIISRLVRGLRTRERFTIRKVAGLILGLIDFVIIVSIFVKDASYVAIGAGLFSAGIAFSLRDPITSVIAWLVILFLRPLKIGDRIKIGTEEGDVINISSFFITLMEIKQWTQGDLYTGRVIEIPNNKLMSESLVNFSMGFNFIWDNITVPLFYDVDLEKAINLVKECADRETKKYMERATKEYEKFKEKHLVERGLIGSQVFVSFNDNYISLNLRYITDLWERKRTESNISIRILEALKKNGIGIASSSMIITTRNEQ